jgi:hypothetical protein
MARQMGCNGVQWRASGTGRSLPHHGRLWSAEDRSRKAWVAPAREILTAKPTDKTPLGGESKCAGSNDE